MKYRENGMIQPEHNEPAMRTCWECNAAHDHLKKVNTLHICSGCGRYWVFDKFLSDFYKGVVSEEEGNKKLVEWFRAKGIEPGESTTKIDGGYRVMTATISFR